jgi:hypothetical protein
MALKKRRKRSKSVGNKRRKKKSIKLKRKFSKKRTIKRRRKQKGGNWLTNLFTEKPTAAASPTLPPSSDNKGLFNGIKEDAAAARAKLDATIQQAKESLDRLPKFNQFTSNGSSNNQVKDLLKSLKAKLKELTIALASAEAVVSEVENKSDALCKTDIGTGIMELPKEQVPPLESVVPAIPTDRTNYN